ncbi:MAG: alpha/beta fold hydrolase [Akkermansia sp.]|nr:alpha/beta fold hydrolase [Akkermansia sp.]
MHAKRLTLTFFLAGCFVSPAEQPVSVVASQQLRQPIPQLELDLQGQGTALVFIGGLGDEISGIVPHMMATMPPVSSQETRAYYHWHAGNPQQADRGAAALAARIRAYRHRNSAADIVLIGHSMGAATAMKTAAALPPGEGRVFVVTLDPSDRSYAPVRPPSVSWWGNAYVVNSRSAHDYIAVWGGRWNACKQADTNLRFDGRLRDESGYFYIHDNALSLMCSRGRGRHASLYDEICRRLRTESAPSREADTSRQQLPGERADTK